MFRLPRIKAAVCICLIALAFACFGMMNPQAHAYAEQPDRNAMAGTGELPKGGGSVTDEVYGAKPQGAALAAEPPLLSGKAEELIEIKSYKPEIIDALVKLIQDKKVEDQVVAISFNTDQLRLLGEKMPGMSLGYLMGGYVDESNINKSLRDTLQAVQNMNATFNTNYSGLGKTFMEAAKHRGLTIWPWTYRDQGDVMKYFRLGTYGLTMDDADWVSDWAKELKPKQDNYTMAAGQDLTLLADLETYQGEQQEIMPEIVLLDGQQVVEVSGNKVTAKEEGTANVLLRYAFAIDGNHKYDIYAEPIRIAVGDDSQPEEPLSIETSWNMDSLEPGKLLTAELKIANRQKSPKQVLAMVALYDGQGKMEGFSYVSRTMNGGSEERLIPGIRLPDALKGHVAKVMVWDGENLDATSMKPLADISMKK